MFLRRELIQCRVIIIKTFHTGIREEPPENWRLFSLCHACSIIGNADNNKNDPEEIRGRLVLKGY